MNHQGFQHPMARTPDQSGHFGGQAHTNSLLRGRVMISPTANVIAPNTGPSVKTLFDSGVYYYSAGLQVSTQAKSIADYQRAVTYFVNAAVLFGLVTTTEPTHSLINREVASTQVANNAVMAATDMQSASADSNTAQAAAGNAYGIAYKFLLDQEEMPVMYRQGQWITTTRFPATLVGLGETPRAAEGRWWARRGNVAMTWTGLGDINSDWSSGEAAYNKANSEMSAASQATDYQQVISDYLTATNDYLAVANDANNSSAAGAIQGYVSAIQTAQSSANATSDTTSAAANATTAQAATISARTLAETIASSNKAGPSNNPGPTVNPAGGGGGGGNQQPPAGSVTCPAGTPNAGQVVSNLSLCGSTAITTTTTASKSWLPWAIAGGVLVGGGAIAYAMHKGKKIRPKKHKA
jgi:hypothetical protein